MIKSKKEATAEAMATNITVGLGARVDCVAVGNAPSVNGTFVVASLSPPDVPGSSDVRSSGATYTMAAEMMLDISLTRPLLWVTFSAKNRVEVKYSGRKRTTNVSVSKGDAGDVKFPLMTSLWPSCDAFSKE